MSRLEAWARTQRECLSSEGSEEALRTPVPLGMTAGGSQADGLVSTLLKRSPTAPLRLLQASGHAVSQLTLCETRSLPGSRRLLYVFSRDEAGAEAGDKARRSGDGGLATEGSALRPRDLVILLDPRLRLLSHGVIHSISSKGISVQLGDGFDAGALEEADWVTLCRAGSEATRNYQLAALEALTASRPLWEGELPAGLSEARRALLGCFFASFSGDAGDRGALHDVGRVRPREGGERPSAAAIDGALGKFSLNSHQRSACQCVLQDFRLSGVWGPPGTGKTTTVAAAIASYLSLNPGRRVLACAPSNTAVDNLVLGAARAFETLGAKVSTVRLGNPARATSEEVYPYLLDVLVNEQGSSEICSLKLEVQRLAATLDKAKKHAASKGGRGQVIEARHALRDALHALSDAQLSAVENVLLGSRLVCATLGSLGGRTCLKAAKFSEGFDLVVVDEAAQALDVSLIGALLLCKGQLCLAGDPMQLPPTILSEGLKGKADFAVPFMTRLVSPPGKERKSAKAVPAEPVASAESEGPDGPGGPGDSSGQADQAGAKPRTQACDVPTITLLETQYRFNNEINEFPSSEFYKGRLSADASCAEISLADFLCRDAGSWFDGEAPRVIFLDTAGFDVREERQEGGITPRDGGGQGGSGGNGGRASGRQASSARGEAFSFLDQYSLKNQGEVSLTMQLFNLIRDALLSRCPSPAARKGPAPLGFSTREEYCAACGIIAPYAAQVSALSAALEWELDHGLEVSTVDGFQGREKEIIFLSMVRSNDAKQVGFLSDGRRLNVSVTRAKRLLVVVGDSETLEGDRVLAEFVTHLMDNALVLTPDTLPEPEVEGE